MRDECAALRCGNVPEGTHRMKVIVRDMNATVSLPNGTLYCRTALDGTMAVVNHRQDGIEYNKNELSGRCIRTTYRHEIRRR